MIQSNIANCGDGLVISGSRSGGGPGCSTHGQDDLTLLTDHTRDIDDVNNRLQLLRNTIDELSFSRTHEDLVSDKGMRSTLSLAIDILGQDMELLKSVDLSQFPEFFARSLAVVGSCHILLQIPVAHRGDNYLPWSYFTDLRFDGWKDLPLASLRAVSSPCKFFYFLLVTLNDTTLNRDCIHHAPLAHTTPLLQKVDGTTKEQRQRQQGIPVMGINSENVVSKQPLACPGSPVLSQDHRKSSSKPLVQAQVFKEKTSGEDRDEEGQGAVGAPGATGTIYSSGMSRESLFRATELQNYNAGPKPTHELRFEDNDEDMDGLATPNMDNSCASPGSMSNRCVVDTDSRHSNNATTPTNLSFREYANQLVDEMMIPGMGLRNEVLEDTELSSILTDEYADLADYELQDLVKLESIMSHSDYGGAMQMLDNDLAQCNYSAGSSSVSIAGHNEINTCSKDNVQSAIEGHQNMVRPLFTMSLEKLVELRMPLTVFPGFFQKRIMDHFYENVDLETLDMAEWPPSTMLHLVTNLDKMRLTKIPRENRGMHVLPWREYCAARFGEDYASSMNQQIVQMFSPCRLFFLLLQREFSDGDL